jgi:hypothetical protein
MPKKPSNPAKVTLERSKAFLVRQAEMLANELRMDPFEIISRYAIGDVVGLGMMTQEELDYPGQKDRKTGKWLRRPGKAVAWDLISSNVRFDAAKELLPYLYAKKQAITISDGKSDDPSTAKRRVVIHLPSNGREVQP